MTLQSSSIRRICCVGQPLHQLTTTCQLHGRSITASYSHCAGLSQPTPAACYITRYCPLKPRTLSLHRHTRPGCLFSSLSPQQSSSLSQTASLGFRMGNTNSSHGMPSGTAARCSIFRSSDAAAPLPHHTQPRSASTAAAPPAAPAAALVPKQAPLVCQDPATDFSVLSYNVLADAFATTTTLKFLTHGKFVRSELVRAEGGLEVPEWLTWQYRWPRMLAEIAAVQADVVCLQEVERDRWEEFLSDLGPLGYEAVLQTNGRQRAGSITNAVFFRKSKFQAGWTRHGSRTLLLQLLWKDVPEKATYLAVVHLEGQPYKPNERFNQLRSLLQKAEGAGVRPSDALVLVGDFNSGPEESAYAYLLQGSLPAGCVDRGVVVTDKAAAHPFQLHDAYLTAGHSPDFTFMTKGLYAGVLDFVLASTSLEVQAVYGGLRPQDRPLVLAENMPNALYPSDHLPVAAVLRQA